MDLNTHFSTLCRQLSISLETETPTIKTLFTRKKGDQKNGRIARYNFGEFTMDIYYIENPKGAAPQIIWLSFFFEKEPAITFSVYDILSVTDPQNFNRYTYAYVDSHELLENCFSEILVLLRTLLPKLKEISQNGVEQNKLIDSQKQKMNQYFGDDIFEASKLLKNSADRILSLMFNNFFQHQIEIYVTGSAALFFEGKTEKALKALKKSKYRSLYEDNLLAYLENGGNAPVLSVAARNASAQNGKSRQGSDAKGLLKILSYTLFFAVPVTILMGLVFIALTYFTTTDYTLIFGIKENLFFIPAFAIPPSVAIAMRYALYKRAKNKNIQAPPLPSKAKILLKYFTIFTETVALISLVVSANSLLVLRDNDFLYPAQEMSFKLTSCEYSIIDYAAIVEGYTYVGEYHKDPHIVFVTDSGTVIDLYNSTYLSTGEFRDKTEEFLKERGIEIKEIKTIN